jgi:predicted naringenin-chalcone synthase
MPAPWIGIELMVLRIANGGPVCAMQRDGIMVLTSFRLLRPRYEARQEEILEWLADVHTRAEATVIGEPSFDPTTFHARMKRLIRHVCCGSDRIASRGYSASDPEHAEIEATALYDVSRHSSGAGTSARTDLYATEVEAAFARLYAAEDEPPDDLVHVTCTGYVSPSGAQRLVSARGWGNRTRVTHAYHMGCYAAVPAMRIATGLARNGDRVRVDVVHTELCSLHFDPAVHTPEQLVVQSLFADGTARYTVSDDARGERALRVLALHEVIADGSEDAMKWRLGDHGMRMTLSRDIPACLGRSIRPFVCALFERAGLDFVRERARCLFAVHPGGPKIIDGVRDALDLEEQQVEASRNVLRRFGNMSSATLPHIWSDLLDDDERPDGTLVVSVAFGPGLTLGGALLRKE